jgi:N-acetylglucosamine-6-sulfatase
MTRAAGRFSVRRPLGALLAFACVATMTVSGPWLAQSRPVPGAPNIVVFLTDDQRWDSLRVMPALQAQLVRRGRLFTDAMVPTSLCCPSRATILTGLYAHDTGVWGNHPPLGAWRRVVQQGLEEDTIATALDERGYETALLGKYFNGFSRWAPDDYVPPGWDHFLAFRTPGHSGTYVDFRLQGSSHFYGPRAYSTDVLAKQADSIISATPEGTPLFMYLATFAPHAPFTPPRRYAARKGEPEALSGPVRVRDRRGKPSWLRRQKPVSAEAMEQIHDGQDRSLRAVDDAVADVLRSLRRTHRLRNTLFIFMSDNGLMRGEHGITGKHVPYDAATRIPMVVRWDGRVAPATRDTRLALNVDIAATVTGAAGVTMATDGLDLLGPVRRGGFPMEAISKHPVGRPAYCGWRTKRYLFVHYADGEEELYDYRVDPRERVNLAGDRAYRDQVRDLRAAARDGCDPVPPGFSWQGDEATR